MQNLPIEIQLYIIKLAFLNENIESINNIRSVNTFYKKICDFHKKNILEFIIPVKNQEYIDPLYMYHIVNNYLVDYSNIIQKINEKFVYNNIRRLNIDVPLEILPILPNVEILYCANIGLKKIIGLPKIKKLICSKNKLSELPDMEFLEYLDCSFNPIKKFPILPSIRNLIYTNLYHES